MSWGVGCKVLYMSMLRVVGWLFMVVVWLGVVGFKLHGRKVVVNGGNLVYFDFV